jgi:hypothetical protein
VNDLFREKSPRVDDVGLVTSDFGFRGRSRENAVSIEEGRSDGNRIGGGRAESG